MRVGGIVVDYGGTAEGGGTVGEIQLQTSPWACCPIILSASPRRQLKTNNRGIRDEQRVCMAFGKLLRLG